MRASEAPGVGEMRIAVAQRVGLPLKIAAKIDPADRASFEREIAPLLRDPLVEFLGEVPDARPPPARLER